MPKTEITLKELIQQIQSGIHFLLSKWMWIGLFGIFGLIGGLCLSFFSRPKYTATISFVTDGDQNSNVGTSGYAGLAAQFGLSLGNGNLQGGLFSGDNIYELMKTRKMLQNTLLTPVNIDGGRILLVNRYIDAERLRKKWDNPRWRAVTFRVDSLSLANGTALSLNQNAVLNNICKRIVERNLKFPAASSSDINKSLLSVSFVSSDEQLSYQFLTRLINNVADFYVETKTKRAKASLDVVEKQLDSIKNQLYGAMSNVASFQDKNLNLVRQGPRVAQQKSSLRLDVNSAIYQQLVTGVETARMNFQKSVPLFQIIDTPVLPLDRSVPNKWLYALLGFFLGCILSAGCISIRQLYHHVMEA